MIIGIDGRMVRETGIGRYIRNVLVSLSRLQHRHRIIVYFRSEQDYDFLPRDSRFCARTAPARWHTLREQIVLPRIYGRDNLDLLHVPYFTVPVFYRGKVITTIHDLTIKHFATGKATTLPMYAYALRRIGYSFVLRSAIVRSCRILTVSHAVKEDICRSFSVPLSKITVTYEACDEEIAQAKKSRGPLFTNPYFLYVGNVYPHKNADLLVESFISWIRQDRGGNRNRHCLVFVGSEDYFYRRLMKSIPPTYAPRIRFFGPAGPDELAGLYDWASALVFPSLSEGFGLPSVEALRRGCPVICSDIPVFHEILEGHATYVPPKDSKKWIEALEKAATHTSLAGRKANVPSVPLRKFLRRYSWDTLGRQTIEAYEHCVCL